MSQWQISVTQQNLWSVRASTINEEMKLAASQALAALSKTEMHIRKVWTKGLASILKRSEIAMKHKWREV